MKKTLLIISIALISLTGYGQQDALFSQYMFNKLVINPGYTGSREVFTGVLVGRMQWLDIDGAPTTGTLSIHSPLKNRNIGLGLCAYADKVGPIEDMGVLGSFSYKIRLGNGKLSFGLQGGVKYLNVDVSELDILDANDLYATEAEIELDNKIQPDVNFGIYYYTDRYYIGVSSKHLLETDYATYESTVSGTEVISNHLLMHFYGMAGVAAPLSDNIVFIPSTLVKYVKNAPLQVDLNANFMFNNTFVLGASYRSEKAVVFMAELLFNNFRFGYSYDIWFNELKAHNTGSHEIMLGLDMGLGSSRMLTPRYF